MNNTIITIMKKELKRFFGDKRMAFSTILLPGLMIYVMYTFMGSAMADKYNVADTYKYKIECVHMPEDVNAMFEAGGLEIKNVDESTFTDSYTEDDFIADQKENLKSKEDKKKLDLIVVFPKDFTESLSKWASGEERGNVELYYNSAATESDAAYDIVKEMLTEYENTITDVFDINKADDPSKYDVAEEKDMMAMVFGSMLPMLLLMFMFSASMAVGPESIAGEKERGTIATMLITPAKRSHIALGKIIALSIIALLSGLSSTIGTMLSIPKMMAVDGESAVKNVYGTKEYVILAFVVLCTIMLIVTIVSLVSAFAKSTKEAQTYVTPIMIIVMVIGLSGMFIDGVSKEAYTYLIPLYNSVQCMLGIFSFDISLQGVIICVISNVIYTGIGVFLLTRMFNSEKIMFNK
ncbi:MAG: ABC transporter permease [Lachnospiraceae bacterium]|nr:ABC transporter permease [Lachnospiraceae bacterium]